MGQKDIFHTVCESQGLITQQKRSGLFFCFILNFRVFYPFFLYLFQKKQKIDIQLYQL